MVGTGAAVDFLASLSAGNSRPERLTIAYDELHKRKSKLVSRIWEGLENIPGVRLYGPAPGTAARTPTVAFTIDGQASTKD